MMKTNLRHLRNSLKLDSVADKVLLLEKHFTALSNGERAPERQRQQVWLILSSFVLSKCISYFKKSASFASGNPELHQERILLLHTFITESYPKHSMRFIMSAYRRRFTMFEAYRQLKEIGINLEGTVTYHTNGTRLIRDYVKFIKVAKQLENGVNSDINLVGELYRESQAKTGGLKGDVHISTFKTNCLLFQEALYAARHSVQYEDGRGYEN